MQNPSRGKATEVCFVLEPTPVDYIKAHQAPIRRPTDAQPDAERAQAAEDRQRYGHAFWTHEAAANPDIHVLKRYFNDLIETPIGGHDFRVFRSSEIDRSNFVTRQHLQLAKDAELMIANLSAPDPIVFYCVAHRMRCREHLSNDPGTIFLRHISSTPLFDNPKVKTITFGLPVEIEGQVEVQNEREIDITSERVLQDARRDLTEIHHVGSSQPENHASD